jgi:SET domain-containing protein
MIAAQDHYETGCRAALMDHSPLVCVKKVKGKGRGVFAREAIRKGAVIERVPVVIVPIKNLVNGRANPVLKKYFYEWGPTTVAVSLGYGSLYNHSYTPNADYDHGEKVLIYRAICDIAAGEEITVNYNGEPTDRTPVGFEVV